MARGRPRISGPPWLVAAQENHPQRNGGLSDHAILQGLQGLSVEEIAGLMGIAPRQVRELSEKYGIKLEPVGPGNASPQSGPLVTTYHRLKEFDPRTVDLKATSPEQFHHLVFPLTGLTQQEIAAYFGVEPRSLLAARRRLSKDGFDFKKSSAYIPPVFRNAAMQDAAHFTPRELLEKLIWEITQKKGKVEIRKLASQITLTGVAFLRARAIAFAEAKPGSQKNWAPLVHPPLMVDALVRALQYEGANADPLTLKTDNQSK